MLQSSELAEECEAPVTVPQNPIMHVPRKVVSPVKNRLPLSKRSARKRRHSIGMHLSAAQLPQLGSLPDIQKRSVSDFSEGAI
jgi:hypothetical protein